MRNYSSKQAKKGKLAYRTPERFIPHQISKTIKVKSIFHDRQRYQQGFGAGFICQKCQKTIKVKAKRK